MLGLCLGGSSLVVAQPAHAILFLLARGGLAAADTSNAALTARLSTPQARGRNLAMLQVAQSGSRIFSPYLAAWLYTAAVPGALASVARPGSLPLFVCGAIALLTAPFPLLLRQRRGKGGAKKDSSYTAEW